MESVIEKIWLAGMADVPPFSPVRFQEAVKVETGFTPDEIEPRELLARAAEIARNRGQVKTADEILSLLPQLPIVSAE